MREQYNEFISYLDKEDKTGAVQYCLSLLSSGAIDVVSLYEEFLSPSLNEEFCDPDKTDTCVWQEHIRTSIVRTIIECSYPFVIQERDEKYRPGKNGRVFVLCPPGEAHELGARMIADFFTLSGFDATYTGANTPQREIIKAIERYQPDIVAISITNAFNLLATARSVQKISDLKERYNFRVIIGGRACKCNPDACIAMSADMLLDSFEDIHRLAGGDSNASV